MANERLRDAMLQNGLTPETLASEIGVDAKTVERWITTGRAPYPRHRYAVAAKVRESESYLWPNAVRRECAASVSQSEVITVYPRRAAVPAELWSRVLDQATDRIGILAYAGLFLPEQNPRLVTSLRKKAEQGAKIEILLGDPDSEHVAQRGAEEGIGDAMAGKIRNVLAFYSQLRDVSGVQVHHHRTTLYNSIYRFDNEMLVNTHVFGFPAAHAPVFHLRRIPGGDLFDTYADSFDRVFSTSVSAWPIEDDKVKVWHG